MREKSTESQMTIDTMERLEKCEQTLKVGSLQLQKICVAFAGNLRKLRRHGQRDFHREFTRLQFVVCLFKLCDLTLKNRKSGDIGDYGDSGQTKNHRDSDLIRVS